MPTNTTEQTGVVWNDAADPTSRTQVEVAGSESASASSSISSMHAFVERTRIDRYSLVNLLGRGSYGTVWAAYDPQLDRRVAIKVTYVRGEDAEAELEQMLREAQMLAQLNHPNVVGVHDVRPLEPDPSRSTRRGLYIVMEYLAGPTLATWLGIHAAREPSAAGEVASESGSEHTTVEPSRGLDEILAAFEGAGRGLAAAHAKSLVHGDFKPANVMFGADGRVRVLDFGLARPEQRERDGKLERAFGTPAYMSPEQHRGEALDARSDQFSFCVALHEALYGERPFTGHDHTSLGEAKHNSEPRPVPRSTKVPARIQAVVRRGLALAPDQRFASMDALLDALLDDPALKRRRWAALALLVAAVAGAAYGLARLQNRPQLDCEPPADAFAQIWDETTRAELRDRFGAIEAEYAAVTLTKVETALDDWTARWRDSYANTCVQVREVDGAFDEHDPTRVCLEHARRRAAGIVGMLREADAAMLVHASDALAGLGRIETCVETRVQSPARDAPARAANEALLAIEADVVRARTLDSLGQHQPAVELARAAAERAVELGDHGGVSRAKQVEAAGLRAHDRFESALAAAELAADEAVLADDHEDLVRALLEQIAIYEQSGQFEATGAVARVARSLVGARSLGPELAVAIDAADGRSRFHRGDLDGAERLLDQARVRAIEVFGDHDPRLADIHDALAMVADARPNRGERAEAHYRSALELREAAYGHLHPSVADSLARLGQHHQSSGALDQARGDVEAALAIDEAVFGDDSPQLIPRLLLLAELHAELDQHQQALALRERAVALSAGLPKHHPVPYKLYLARAASYEALGQREQALADLQLSLDIHRRTYGVDHVDTAIVEARLAELLRASDEQVAAALLAHARPILDARR